MSVGRKNHSGSRFDRFIICILLGLALMIGACRTTAFAPDVKATNNSSGGSTNATGSSASGTTLATPSGAVYPLDGSSPPLVQGQIGTFTVAGATVCTYQTVGLPVTDPNYAAAGTSCTSLDSLQTIAGVLQKSKVTFLSGTLTWQPTGTQRGTYQFTLQNAAGASGSFDVTVREPFSTSNLLAALDAQVAEAGTGLNTHASVPRTGALNNLNPWLGLLSALSGTLNGLFTTLAPWAGAGTAASPYQLAFNGTSDHATLGTPLSGQTKAMFSTWIAPNSASAGSVLLGNGGGTGSGIALRVPATSSVASGHVELVVGHAQTYTSVVLADAPVGYWRLGETAGTTANDSAGAHNGTYTQTFAGDFTLGATGGIVNDAGKAVALTDHGRVLVGNMGITPAAYTIELWAKRNTITNAYGILAGLNSTSHQNSVWAYENGDIGVGDASGVWNTIAAGWTDKTSYHHIVVTASAANNWRVYLDGAYKGTNTGGGLGTVWDSVTINDFGSFFGMGLPGNVQEFALYSYELSSGQIKNHYEAGKAKFNPNAILAAYPSGYWRLGEKGASVAQDLSPNGNNGTYAYVNRGTTGALAAEGDTAASFSGAMSSQAVTIADAPSLNPASISLSAWLNSSVPNNTWAGVIGKTDNAGWLTGYGFFMRNGAPGMLGFYVSNYSSFGTCSVSTAIVNGTWTHFVGTYDGTTVNLYKNGALAASGACAGPYTTSSKSLYIGSIAADAFGNPGYAYTGSIDEVALFGYALTAQQVSNIYNSTSSTTCLSQSTLTNGAWNMISGLWDGSTLSMFINGQKECSITPTGTFASAGTLTMGADTSGASNWKGSVADLKVYGTSNGSAAGSAATILSDFNATANRFQTSQAYDNIITNGLVMHFDAAHAKASMGPYANGCALTDQAWVDLAGTVATPQFYSFSPGSCGAAMGWNGNGSAANPYTLTFDGATNYLYLPGAYNTSTIQGNDASTVELWFNASAIGVGPVAFNVGNIDYFIEIFNNGSIAWSVGGGARSYPAGSISAGNWFHVVAAKAGAGDVGDLYVNGTKLTGQVGTLNSMVNATKDIYIGAANNGGAYDYFQGAIPIVRMYNRTLSQSEISQNCFAQASRFTGVTCH